MSLLCCFLKASSLLSYPILDLFPQINISGKYSNIFKTRASIISYGSFMIKNKCKTHT